MSSTNTKCPRTSGKTPSPPGGRSIAACCARTPWWNTWRLLRIWKCTESTTLRFATRRAPNCGWAWTRWAWTFTKRTTNWRPRLASPGPRSVTFPSTIASSSSSRSTRRRPTLSSLHHVFASTSAFWLCAWATMSSICADASQTPSMFSRWRHRREKRRTPSNRSERNSRWRLRPEKRQRRSNKSTRIVCEQCRMKLTDRRWIFGRPLIFL